MGEGKVQDRGWETCVGLTSHGSSVVKTTCIGGWAQVSIMCRHILYVLLAPKVLCG